MYVDEKKTGEVVFPDEAWRQRLREAADRLEREGWCQKVLRNRHGARCAAGAIFNLGDEVIHWHAMEDVVGVEADQRLSRYLQRAHQEYSVVLWNDRPGRTKEEVIAVLREAANAP